MQEFAPRQAETIRERSGRGWFWKKVFDKVLHTKLGTINKIIDEVFPQVSTSFSLKNLIGLAADATQYQLGEVEGYFHLS